MSVRLRRAIWGYCSRRKLQRPIVMSWYDNLRVRVFLGNDMSRMLFVGGCIEPNEFFFLSKILRHGMVCVDVGANEGLYSLFAASRVGIQGVVLAVEPSGREFARLKDNLSLNRLHNVRPFRLALFSNTGYGELAIAEYEHEGQNTLGRRIANPLVKSDSIERVQLKRLDELLQEEDISRLDFVKLDVEGAELHVLRGGEEAIRRHQPVLQLEINEQGLHLQATSKEQLFEMLLSWNYRFFSFGHSGQLMPSHSADMLEDNVIAVPLGHPVFLSIGASSRAEPAVAKVKD